MNLTWWSLVVMKWRNRRILYDKKGAQDYPGTHSKELMENQKQFQRVKSTNLLLEHSRD